MAEKSNTTTEARERPSDIIAQLHAAGVDHDLTMRVFEYVETERAEAIAKAARLFYHRGGEQERPITLGDFSDQFNNMTRRMWGLVCAVGDLVGDRDDSVGPGVLQLVEDAALEMERLAETFSAEHWLERKWDKRS